MEAAGGGAVGKTGALYMGYTVHDVEKVSIVLPILTSDLFFLILLFFLLLIFSTSVIIPLEASAQPF